MTDDQQWQAPDSAIPPHASSPEGSLPFPDAPFASGAPVAPGWTPPPKPGLIPLRAMTLGTILSASFQTLRRNPAATLGPALVLSLVIALIQALGSAGFWAHYLGALSSLGNPTGSSPTGFTAGLTSSSIGLLATSLGSGALALIAGAIVQGIVTLQVASSTLGTRLRLSGLWRRMRGRRGAVIGWALLSGGVALLAVAVIAGVLIAIGSAGAVALVVAVLLGLLLGAGLFVVFVWLWVKLGFVPAIIVLERASIRAAMRRSWALTRAGFWRIFGIRLLVAAMIAVATNIVTTPISFVVTIAGGVLTPTGSTAAGAGQTLVVALIVTQAVTAVISAVGLVLSASTLALLYLDQRMRLEGLDLDLARYVEYRQAGAQDLPDPYLAPERAAPGGAG